MHNYCCIAPSNRLCKRQQPSANGCRMNQPVAKEAFAQADKLFRDTFSASTVLAIAEKTVTTSKEFYEKAAAAAQDGAKALTEIADAAWGSTKLLNEKLAQNLTANVDAAFSAAQRLAEIGKIQS